ncbi:hypothetical protein BWD42_12980 [Sphingobacterium sp. CZ-UAM]|uniref:hypothetical protein n=1 Tax=Sphingobacterium sp. CZ-UAM TaxID=1933868 RepID=UPI0009877933|nr:hypothetical protein [Sphingobacterium sp. CZ-UAM]OOG18175.1 hypothetical protein BWD42_12980 [Sphingobacterium sp. CZ-UAM]
MDNNIGDYNFSRYFEHIAQDNRLLPSHIGLVMALFYYQGKNDPLDFFHSSRRKLMHFSRIRSIATYHRCLSELVRYGYLEYIPSWHPTRASRFRFIANNNPGSNG